MIIGKFTFTHTEKRFLSGVGSVVCQHQTFVRYELDDNSVVIKKIINIYLRYKLLLVIPAKGSLIRSASDFIIIENYEFLSFETDDELFELFVLIFILFSFQALQ